ncbi:MAG: ParB/RepB/Spo0J family partition protein [Eubacteriales bacterium]|nr:ParB/RepB/Spo0J family partition protein [Eubacteriales bacterium]MDD3350724.1 ParB/RepB/Spo0J family partition protein [Eubacteriales bacterium]
MATAKSRGLGKGLEALFTDVEITVGGNRSENNLSFDKREMNDRVVTVDIHKIKPNVGQPRKHFDEQKLSELANSIEIHGVIQPILVREVAGGFEIVAGERRFRAARKAGLKELPCIVRELSEEQNMLIALIENMQREDLNPIEEAEGLAKMIETYGLTQEEVSRSVGKSRPYISNALRLLKLPEKIQELVVTGKLTGGHARTLVVVDALEKQLAIAEKCVRKNLSVRELEELVRNDGTKKRAVKRAKNRDLTHLEEEMKTILGTKVNIQHGARKGKIEIEYYSREELERLLELLQTLRNR